MTLQSLQYSGLQSSSRLASCSVAPPPWPSCSDGLGLGGRDPSEGRGSAASGAGRWKCRGSGGGPRACGGGAVWKGGGGWHMSSSGGFRSDSGPGNDITVTSAARGRNIEELQLQFQSRTFLMNHLPSSELRCAIS